MILRTALLALKYIFRDELRERLPEILGLLRELGQGSSALDNVMTLLRNLAQEANAERLNGTELRQAVVTTLSGGGELMMTIAEQWVQEGLQESLNSVRQLLLRLVRRAGRAEPGVAGADHGAAGVGRIGGSVAGLRRWRGVAGSAGAAGSTLRP